MPTTSQGMQSLALSTSGQGQASSAQVLEFVCLFTHDLKRKQKRWQDGRLKFHSFNQRIMVYDERGNFIGDTHWREDYEFGDGEEVQLERGGILVQTSECVGSRNQDLSELIDKRVQEKVQRQSTAAARTSRPRPAPSGGMPVVPPAGTPHFQLRHTPLHGLVSPTGHHGRALVPSESPFEQRQRMNVQESPGLQEESPHPAKRRRREASPPSKSGYAQSLFGAILTLSGRPMSSAPIRHKAMSSQTHRQEHDTPVSSALSMQDIDGDEVHEVSLQAKSKPHQGVPLSEREPAAINTSRPHSEALVGKDARSKANITSLLHQSRPQVPRIVDKPRKAPLAKSRSANHFIESDNEVDTVPMEENTAKLGRQKRSTTHYNVQDQPRPKVKAPTDESAAPLDASTEPRYPNNSQRYKAIVDELDPLLRPSPVGRKLSIPGETTKSRGKQLRSTENSDSVIEKPVVREPRIELRIGPSKRRGLLMISEKGSKKARKPNKSESQANSSHFGSPQTVSSEQNGKSLVLTDDHPSKRGVAGSVQRDERVGRQPFNDNPILIDDDVPKEGATISDIKKTKSSHRNADGSSHGFTNSSTEEELARVDTLNFAPERKTVTRHSVMSANGESCSKYGSSNAEVLVKKRPNKDSGCKESPERRSKCTRLAAKVVEDSHEVPARKKGEEKDLEDIFSRQPGNAPPPRLAQLSRKSVRSKEVIGLFFEDDDNDGPLFQPKRDVPNIQQVSVEARMRSPAATRPSTLYEERGTTPLMNVAAMVASSLPHNQQLQSYADTYEMVATNPVKDAKGNMDLEAAPSKPVEIPAQDRRNSPLPSDLPAANSKLLTRASMNLASSKHAKLAPSEAVIAEVESVVTSENRQGRSALVAEADSETPEMAKKITTTLENTKHPSLEGVLTQIPPAINRTDQPSDSVTNANPKSQSFHGPDTLAKRNNDLQASRSTEVVETTRPIPRKQPETLYNVSLKTEVLEGDKHRETTNSLVHIAKPVPRIVNPATRGKKAAKRTDAAGQIPERVIPTDDRVLVRVANNPAKEQSNALPGFSKANGGPWSREAHDLFEYKRPS
ncbi:hypothetical protein BKA67DRAFT_660520 [Truncatella angustata]|uniref:5'-3' DNA helicase ZGRF1-like N-terminal domain-containing protein n=1 Tax=Truncatella angustata TaxID=152316 RepID=A0A9P8UGR8_9PEZI|nr:uncharacterized protein BKA67DRAFT_660520 [Truncatella angustata]KAH6651732.1 hypothetical protein BKA67DRAFT_660520 [Truncatella angustata]